MKSVVEGDDRLALREGAGELDGVLDGFRAAVEEDRLLRPGSRRHVDQAAADLDVVLVRGHVKAGVQKLAVLLPEGGDDLRMAMPDVEGFDAAREVDVLLAVDVPDLG